METFKTCNNYSMLFSRYFLISTYKVALGIFNCFSNNDVTSCYGQDTITSIEHAKQFVECNELQRKNEALYGKSK